MGMSALLSWIPDDRPRERLAARGASALSDGELVAILLGTGRPGENVVELAGALLARIGGVRELAQANEPELCAQPGVGRARAAVVHAAMELGRRAAGAPPRVAAWGPLPTCGPTTGPAWASPLSRSSGPWPSTSATACSSSCAPPAARSPASRFTHATSSAPSSALRPPR